MNSQTLVTVLIGIIGLGAGYLFGTSLNMFQSDTHRMADGTMMQDTAHDDMHDMMKSMMSGLEGKTGDAFDQAFLEEMIVHHKGAIDMAQALLKNTTRPELKKLGADIIAAQTQEVDMMSEWLREWFNAQN